MAPELPTEIVFAIARAAHEVNRAYCAALGDDSQPPWETAPDWQRQSAIDGVRFHLSGDHGPEASHDNWVYEKVANGWKYGAVKDPDKKTHPCLVPFNELPAEQRAKDHLFSAVVREFDALGIAMMIAWHKAEVFALIPPLQEIASQNLPEEMPAEQRDGGSYADAYVEAVNRARKAMNELSPSLIRQWTEDGHDFFAAEEGGQR